MNKMIYLDNAATTRTAPEVVEAMLPYFTELYGNPSSVYDFAGKSKAAVTEARETMRGSWAKKEEIYFTAGGTEAQLGVEGCLRPMPPRETTSLPRRLSIMPFCIPAST